MRTFPKEETSAPILITDILTKEETLAPTSYLKTKRRILLIKAFIFIIMNKVNKRYPEEKN